MKRKQSTYLLSLLFSVLLALLLGALIMSLSGSNPIEGYTALVSGALGTQRGIGNTVAKWSVLFLCGLATAVAAQAGIFNVGGEGQLFLGAMASAWVGAALKGTSPWIGIPLSLLSAMTAGALFALIPALLKVKLKVNEVVTTIMLNSVAIYFCSYLANGPLKTAEKGVSAGTNAIDKAFMFPKMIRMSSLTESIFISAAIALFIWYLMTRTTIGFEMKLTGQNPRFARYSGLKSDKLAIGSMMLSGAICGLVGMFEIFGQHGRFIESVSKEFYFDGMLVAMIMHYRPLGIILMSFFFAVLKIGATSMESKVGISSELILIVQSIIIFFMAAEEGIMAIIRKRRAHRMADTTLRKEADT